MGEASRGTCFEFGFGRDPHLQGSAAERKDESSFRAGPSKSSPGATSAALTAFLGCRGRVKIAFRPNHTIESYRPPSSKETIIVALLAWVGAESRFRCPQCTVQSLRTAGLGDPASSRPPVPRRLLFASSPTLLRFSPPPHTHTQTPFLCSVQLLMTPSLIIWGVNFRIFI